MYFECRQRNGGHFSKGDELEYATKIITYEYDQYQGELYNIYATVETGRDYHLFSATYIGIRDNVRIYKVHLTFYRHPQYGGWSCNCTVVNE